MDELPHLLKSPPQRSWHLVPTQFPVLLPPRPGFPCSRGAQMRPRLSLQGSQGCQGPAMAFRAGFAPPRLPAAPGSGPSSSQPPMTPPSPDSQATAPPTHAPAPRPGLQAAPPLRVARTAWPRAPQGTLSSARAGSFAPQAGLSREEPPHWYLAPWGEPGCSQDSSSIRPARLPASSGR